MPVLAALLLVSGPVLGSAPDDEDYRNAVLSLTIHARALFEGHYPFWTSALGFGLPHPLHPSLVLHPLMPLFGALSPDAAVRVFYAVHTVLGGWGCWALPRHLGVRPWIAGIASSTWLLATPAQNYALTDFWPTYFVGWSLLPIVLLCTLRVLDAPPESPRWRSAVLLGFVAGFQLLNGHAGHAPAVFLAPAILVLIDRRRATAAARPLLLACGLGLLIGAPLLAGLVGELAHFPQNLPRRTVDIEMGWTGAVDLLLRPFVWISRDGMLEEVSVRGARVPFFGGPMLLLAVAGVVYSVSPLRRSLSAIFVIALALVFLPNLGDSGPVSGMLYFRDPLVVAGIALGSLALERWQLRAPNAARMTGAFQVAVLVLAVWPFATEAWVGAAPMRAVHEVRSSDALGEWIAPLPGRWYLAPELEERLNSGALIEDGLWRDVWVYRGLPVVNGTFKGVSADRMYPSESMPIGRIAGHTSTVQSGPTLDVLGIGAVLALDGEPVACALEEVARIPLSGGRDLRLLRNPRAWPGAAFIDAGILDRPLTTLRGCPGGVTCLDFAPVARADADTDVRFTRSHDRLRVRFEPSGDTRMLLVSEMYRPEWKAIGGNVSLRLVSAWDGLIAVEVPAGLDSIELRYRPALLLILAAVSASTQVALLLGLCCAPVLRRQA